jgi:hypothetical protein
MTMKVTIDADMRVLLAVLAMAFAAAMVKR